MLKLLVKGIVKHNEYDLTAKKSVINRIWFLFPLSGSPAIMIGPGGLL
jgi:hypothetical protein